MSYTYSGIDVNKQTSLFEYGLLVKRTGKDEYFVVYGVEPHPQGFMKFDTIYTTEKEINDLIELAWFKDGFWGWLGITKEEWLRSYIVHKIHDLLNFYGPETIFGVSTTTLTAKEVAKRTKVKSPY